MKHVLCSIDLTESDAARTILVEADRLAGFYGATLSVVTVLPDYGSSFVASFFREGAMEEAISAANDTLHQIVRDTLPDRSDVQHIVKVGVVYEEVLSAAEACNADLIVVGAHKPDLADRIQGPNSARIGRYTKASVLVLRV